MASLLLRSARLSSTTRPLRPSEAILVPWVLVMMVLPHSLVAKMEGAMSLYHSFFRKGSWAFFFPPFLLFVSRLFFPCGIRVRKLATLIGLEVAYVGSLLALFEVVVI